MNPSLKIIGSNVLIVSLGVRSLRPIQTLFLSNIISENIRWVASFPTDLGASKINIPYKNFEPTIRAKPIRIPLKLDYSCINQFQLLYSKFGQPGKMNLKFKPGPIKVLIRSISAYT